MPDDLHPSIPRARHRLAPFLLAMIVVAGLSAALPAAPADAGWTPGPPVGDYTPHRVWQMKSNCVWAAGVMLLDKWTHGRVRVGQGVLRRASKDKGSSSLYDLAKGISRVTGIRLLFSPGYGDTMTWWQLLDRLEHDGGAVLIGSFSRLPAHYRRWSPAFARRRNSGHAVYVERYDRARGRVWLMDPLAEGHYAGEWIAVEALHRYATLKDGNVMAAATPARHRPTTAPLIDRAYRLGVPELAAAPVAGSTVRVHVDLSARYGFPRPAAQRLIANWVPVPVPLPPLPPGAPAFTSGAVPGAPGAADPTVEPGPSPSPDPPRRAPAAIDTVPTSRGGAAAGPVEVVTASAPDRADAHGFDAALPVPNAAGTYRLVIGLAEPGRRAPSRTLAPITVEVVPSFAGTISLAAQGDVRTGIPIPVRLTVANIGSFDWRPIPSPTTDAHPVAPAAGQTQVVLTWTSTDGRQIPAGALPADLAPGQIARLKISLVPPAEAGPWTLSGDIVNLGRGALSATGWAPPTLTIVVEPRGLAAEP